MKKSINPEQPCYICGEDTFNKWKGTIAKQIVCDSCIYKFNIYIKSIDCLNQFKKNKKFVLPEN